MSYINCHFHFKFLSHILISQVLCYILCHRYKTFLHLSECPLLITLSPLDPWISFLLTFDWMSFFHGVGFPHTVVCHDYMLILCLKICLPALLFTIACLLWLTGTDKWLVSLVCGLSNPPGSQYVTGVLLCLSLAPTLKDLVWG